MKDSIFRAACVAWLCACATTPARQAERPEMFITEAEAARLSAAALIRLYVVNEDGAALVLSSRDCPAQNSRADSLVTGLLQLAPSGERTRDFALSWQRLMSQCGDARVASWYRDAIRRNHDDLTVELVTRGLLRTRDPLNIGAVKTAAFDTANTPDARNAMLNLYVEELDFSGDERVALMIESYRQTGEIPGRFAASQAPRLWALRTRQWRESLLAEVVAAPGKPGAPALLLTLARESRDAPDGSPWRRVWETALGVLAQHPDASADLKAMVPIAQQVGRHQKN